MIPYLVGIDGIPLRYPSTTPPTSGGVTLTTLFSRGSGSRETPSFSRVIEDTVERRCTVRCPSHEWIRGHVFTHRCRLPELEGSVIFVLGRIASLFLEMIVQIRGIIIQSLFAHD